jgi:uncharacterized membrane protein (DUF485 family)
VVPDIFCPKCSAPVSDTAPVCPVCRTRDPGRRRATAFGLILLSALAAAAVTGLYAWLLSGVWDRWEAKFDRLPEGHPLYESASEAAFGLGVAVFLVSWLLTAIRLGYAAGRR